MRIKILFFLSIVLFESVFGQKEEKWTVRTSKEGITVYTRALSGSRVKAVKVEGSLSVSMSQLVAVLFDIKTSAEWVYSTKSCILLKQVSPSELYYYSEISLPWPLSNRDFVAHLKATQDAHTKVVTIDGPAIPGYVPLKPNIVRVSQSEGRWVITPVAKNICHVVYTLQVDPGGNIPSWLINLFVGRGPYETFKKLKFHLKKREYSNVHLPFITE